MAQQGWGHVRGGSRNLRISTGQEQIQGVVFESDADGSSDAYSIQNTFKFGALNILSLECLAKSAENVNTRGSEIQPTTYIIEYTNILQALFIHSSSFNSKEVKRSFLATKILPSSVFNPGDAFTRMGISMLTIWYQCHGKYPVNPLEIRIAVISLGPIVGNAAILLALFIVSLFLGPILDINFPKFGSAIAFIAHGLGLVGMLGFFEFLYAVLGLITVIAIQRAIHKVMVSVFLTREFKHDETNRA
ncbi:hypothetical protein DFH08DRAFT_940941 [Mycena albidolilacea]|uniref:Uncharacterized protein n=1 Tax=Mycena albidolilacea TaxID=1033008 RepID=A0AAD6ZKU3_9AGAR|nr:hypothetical protein DFH08DRAFT_940941 [Mycena albidolilacea]